MLLLLLLAALALPATKQASAFVITPTPDTSITTAPSASTIEGSIQSVVSTDESLIKDPVNVSIFVSMGQLPPQYVSFSFGTGYTTSYDFYTGLLAQKGVLTQNPVLATAVAKLPRSNKADNLRLNSVDLRVLGVNAPGLLGPNGVRGDGSFDGVISLTPKTFLQYSHPMAPNKIGRLACRRSQWP